MQVAKWGVNNSILFPKLIRKMPIFWNLTFSKLGMAMGRVRAGFFHTLTRPARQDPWPGPASFRVPGFFLGPGPAPARPHGPRGPRLKIGPNSWPNQKKKKKKSRFIFSFVQAQIYFCHSSLHIPNKKIKPNVRFLRESHLDRKSVV